jgi:hypothetical protein
MQEQIKHMLEQKTWAVVGATQNEDKFGYKILMRLRAAGHETYAVNPMYEAAELGIQYLWFQPGTFDDEVIKYTEDKGLIPVYHHCVLVELGKIGK